MKVRLKVEKGALAPADESARLALRGLKLKTGEVVHAVISKPRNPEFHRLVHQIGSMVADNIEAFNGKNAHETLKKLQLDADIECETQILDIPGIGACAIRTAKSMAFSSMDEITFRAFAHAICRHIAETYWPDMTAEQVQEMAEVFVNEG